MAYDGELVERIRALLVGELDVTDKRMFGGVAFLTGGHMAVAASRNGGLMARVDPEDSEKLLLRDGVSKMVMGGRSMNGWLHVEGAQLADEQLAEWVDRGLDFARSLPANRPD
ncbi:TfoX/Sxy family protein [Flexivirga alba]|uniref:TfoX/Sxy family protein n=1 Tax=Flexivirga alba TaxID=702742 RepID=A0ABW2AN86_9MICO